jgi:hypothetical protein
VLFGVSLALAILGGGMLAVGVIEPRRIQKSPPLPSGEGTGG